MIIKVIDTYFYTKLSPDPAKVLIEKLLEEHVRELSDFDLEHFTEMLEETDKFNVVEDDIEEADLEYTQDEIDEFVDSITSEDYDDEEEDEDDEDDDEYYDEDEEDYDDTDGEGWD